MNDKQQRRLTALQGLLLLSTPVTSKPYFFVTWSETEKVYTTLALTPLYRDFVASNPCFIDIGFGDHRFKVRCENDVWMLPHDAEDLSRMALGASSIITDNKNNGKQYAYHEAFIHEVEKHFAFQLHNGALYKKEREGIWNEVKLPPIPKLPPSEY